MNESIPLEISCADVRDRLSDDQLLLLDCREPPEFALATIAGALQLPMSEIASRVGELDDQRARHIVVFCHHGGRSAQVAAWLRSNGFPQAQSMAGGIDHWAASIDPTIPRY